MQKESNFIRKDRGKRETKSSGEEYKTVNTNHSPGSGDALSIINLGQDVAFLDSPSDPQTERKLHILVPKTYKKFKMTAFNLCRDACTAQQSCRFQKQKGFA